LIDYSALHHITIDPQNLMEIVPTQTDANVFLRNGQGLHVHLSNFAKFSSGPNPHVPLYLKNC